MSSDLFFFDGSSSSLYQNSSPDELLSSDADFFFSDHDLSSIEILQALSDHQAPTEQQNPQPEPFVSPPSHELQTLNLGFHGGMDDCFSVKTEECAPTGLDDGGLFAGVSPQNLQFGPPNAGKLMQRSLSINSFEQKPFGFSDLPMFSPRFDSLTAEPPSFHGQALASSENGFLRRACSAGDLQSFGTVRATQRSLSSPLASEESNSNRVGKYNAEERKERISKYKAKRTLRNFNKTIKYACRKTLADNRPRIRGRFARNDEPDVPKASTSRNDDDDDLWLEGLHEEEEYTARPQFVNSYGPTQFQYYGF